MPTYVMPGVEVTNRYEHVYTPSTHTIVHELHNRNITDSATSWSSECCVPSVNRADDSEFLFFFLFFVRQKEPSRSDHAKNHIETETKHPFTTAEFALKFLRHMFYFVLVQDTLSSQCLAPSRSLNGYLWTDRKKKKPEEMLSRELGRGGMSRTSIPARGRVAILLVTSRYRNKNRLLVDRHLGLSTDLSLYALNKK